MTTERDLERIFRREVKAIGGHALKLAPTEAGVPDRLVLAPGGRLLLVELKTSVGRLSAVQLNWHHQAALLGTKVEVLYGAIDIRRWIADVG